ncbi:hypothetical protein ANCCAN_18280 [Ancylostoma caninum]|uniref:Uncharacterized protein n=1 Tax=Ancylostoma caninum TaxID=29170 RepID=A0A368FUJ8_ANCCA|nr:hypothetical protein ANCCAN_18280 [Ancylostoma caninum]
MSGSELELIAMVTIPVAVVEGLVPCKKRAAVALASVAITALLQGTPLTRKLVEKISGIMRLCSTLFDSAFGSHAATYKKHLWFDHGCDDLMAAGNPAEYSTSMFESEYRLLKRGLRLGNTRAPAKTAFIL